MNNDQAAVEKHLLLPEYVSSSQAERVLHFLNTARNSEEIAEAIESPERQKVGIKIAKNILAARQELGQFKNLDELLDIPQIGTQRFSGIVKSIGRLDNTQRLAVEVERLQFRSLIFKNPNYFGNVKTSPFAPVKTMTGNKAYEELKCIGFNPQFDRLESAVLIKREKGYGGDVCSSGTREYIRFFADWKNDGNWTDLGMTHFDAYDIPGDKPVEYGVVFDIVTSKKWCGIQNLPKIRGILAWNNPPPVDDPDFKPVWGNILEVCIQLEPLKIMPIAEILEITKAKIPETLTNTLDLNQEIALTEPKAMSAIELAELYKDKDVPAHRFGFNLAQKLLIKPAAFANVSAAEFAFLETKIPDIKSSALLEAILSADGNTRYEELRCTGFENHSSNLVGILTVKAPFGYSGDLCKKGSFEYVAFWEWDQIEQIWVYLGTASVNVHDISSIPSGGLSYAVFLPIDLSHHQKPCNQGAGLVKIRAILSWEMPPPKDNPNWIPTWGNRKEALIHIKPGIAVPEIIHTPYIETVASMGVDDIDNSTGLADGASAGTAAFIASDSPFGGEIRITGRILHPPDSFIGGAQELKYKVSVRRSGTGEIWQPLTNSFNIKLATLTGGMYTGPYNYLQQVVDGIWYRYLEDYSGPDKRFLPVPLLAVWRTSGDMTGLWEIRIDAHDPNTGINWPGSQIIKVRLDQKAPKAAITITGFSHNTGPVLASKPCGKFRAGDTIHGSYSVTDDEGHFRILALGVLPGGSGWPSFGAIPSPSSRSYPVVSTNGETGNWTLDTSGMAPCGYVVHLWAEDRTIVNGGYIGWRNSDNVGFCLE